MKEISEITDAELVNDARARHYDPRVISDRHVQAHRNLGVPIPGMSMESAIAACNCGQWGTRLRYDGDLAGLCATFTCPEHGSVTLDAAPCAKRSRRNY